MCGLANVSLRLYTMVVSGVVRSLSNDQRTRLPPSHGTSTFVLSNPAASRNGFIGAPLEPHHHLVVTDRDSRHGGDEIAEQVT
jgi:hypothetical protein